MRTVGRGGISLSAKDVQGHFALSTLGHYHNRTITTTSLFNPIPPTPTHKPTHPFEKLVPPFRKARPHLEHAVHQRVEALPHKPQRRDLVQRVREVAARAAVRVRAADGDVVRAVQAAVLGLVFSVVQFTSVRVGGSASGVGELSGWQCVHMRRQGTACMAKLLRRKRWCFAMAPRSKEEPRQEWQEGIHKFCSKLQGE